MNLSHRRAVVLGPDGSPSWAWFSLVASLVVLGTFLATMLLMAPALR